MPDLMRMLDEGDELIEKHEKGEISGLTEWCRDRAVGLLYAAVGIRRSQKGWKERCRRLSERFEVMQEALDLLRLARLTVEEPECWICGKPATCYGFYEGRGGWACDDCCGHACEDGECRPRTTVQVMVSALKGGMP